MPTKFCFALVLLLITAAAQAQRFEYTPKEPKAGETINITYTPGAALLKGGAPIESIRDNRGSKGNRENITLVRRGDAYTATVPTDTGDLYIAFSFYAGEAKDMAKDYTVSLYAADGKPRRGAYRSMALQYGRDLVKAEAALQKEAELYPESADEMRYAIWGLHKKDSAAKANIAAEETRLKATLKSEGDYKKLIALYSAVGNPQKAQETRKEMLAAGFGPQGATPQQKASLIVKETDAAKKEKMIDDLMAEARVEAAKPDADRMWSFYLEVEGSMRSAGYQTQLDKMPFAAFKKKNAVAFEKWPATMAMMLNNQAWQLQEKGQKLADAAAMAEWAASWAKGEMTAPKAKKPANQTTREWAKEREGQYAMFADTYAMTLFKSGQAKKALPYANDIVRITKGERAEYNATWASIAEKALKPADFRKGLEGYIRAGAATPEMEAQLKKAYPLTGGKAADWDAHLAGLQSAARAARREKLRSTMLSDAAPSFALLDLDGKPVALNDLRGKVVVTDFWATWCGPCKASFPSMQKLVTKYKDDPNVRFVFIDSWEQGESPETIKTSVQKFISDKKYSFQVLMDTDNKVIDAFGVEGIPTKFVIDKSGVIRFKSVGFDASHTEDELQSMIELAAAAAPNM